MYSVNNNKPPTNTILRFLRVTSELRPQPMLWPAVLGQDKCSDTYIAAIPGLKLISFIGNIFMNITENL